MNKQSWFQKFLLLMILAGPIAYAFSVVIHSQTLAGFNQSSIFFWLMVALTEETVKWLVVRQMKFMSGLYFIIGISTLESLVYALLAEAYGWSGLIIGVLFWFVLIRRFIFNGHVLFYLAGFAATRLADKELPKFRKFLRGTGLNISAAGLFVGILGHLYWNWMQIEYRNDVTPFMLVVGLLVALSAYGLWKSGTLKDLYR